jgi:hypothetical protein
VLPSDGLTQTASVSAGGQAEDAAFGDDIAVLADLWLRWWQFGRRLTDELLRTVQVLVRLIPSASFIDLATGRGTDPVFPVLT